MCNAVDAVDVDGRMSKTSIVATLYGSPLSESEHAKLASIDNHPAVEVWRLDSGRGAVIFARSSYTEVKSESCGARDLYVVSKRTMSQWEGRIRDAAREHGVELTLPTRWMIVNDLVDQPQE